MHKNPAELIKKLQSDPGPYQEMRAALQIIGDKWSGLILISLFDQPCRFTDLQALLPDMSPRTLSQRLQAMEEFGLVTKQEYREFPPRTEYRLTQKAQDLRPVLRELKQWAKKYYADHQG